MGFGRDGYREPLLDSLARRCGPRRSRARFVGTVHRLDREEALAWRPFKRRNVKADLDLTISYI